MITWELKTDKGSRAHNEDAIGSCKIGDRYCFVLADGLGGHGKGEVASELAVSTILSEFKENYDRDTFLENGFQRAQQAILQEQEDKQCKNGMKTTVVCLFIDGDYVQWGHVGDSRLYILKKGKIKKRTIDHSIPQMLVLSKMLKEKEIRFHEDRNRLLKVLGIESDKPLYEISEPIRLQNRQQFLLCSDGFWEFIFEKDMEKQFKKSSSVEEWVSQMEKFVLKNGQGKQMDNYSAIGIWIE